MLSNALPPSSILDEDTSSFGHYITGLVRQSSEEGNKYKELWNKMAALFDRLFGCQPTTLKTMIELAEAVRIRQEKLPLSSTASGRDEDIKHYFGQACLFFSHYRANGAASDLDATIEMLMAARESGRGILGMQNAFFTCRVSDIYSPCQAGSSSSKLTKTEDISTSSGSSDLQLSERHKDGNTVLYPGSSSIGSTHHDSIGYPVFPDGTDGPLGCVLDSEDSHIFPYVALTKSSSHKGENDPPVLSKAKSKHKQIQAHDRPLRRDGEDSSLLEEETRMFDAKRRMNTVAARKSRTRKQEYRQMEWAAFDRQMSTPDEVGGSDAYTHEDRPTRRLPRSRHSSPSLEH